MSRESAVEQHGQGGLLYEPDELPFVDLRQRERGPLVRDQLNLRAGHHSEEKNHLLIGC